MADEGVAGADQGPISLKSDQIRRGASTSSDLDHAYIGQLEESAAEANVHKFLGRKRPQPHRNWSQRYVKLLVVGDSGLGKTTLCQCLLSVPGSDLKLHDGTATSHQQFLEDPESLCSTVSWDDNTDKVKWVYKVQDTPGYGDNLNIMNSIHLLQQYVERQNKVWLSVEMDKGRGVDLADVEDPRVDLCLFCIQAHRLRPVDLRFMAELGKVVPILPIVTKSDSMTIREAATYRREVYRKLQNPQLPEPQGSAALGGISSAINVFTFEDATLERAGLLQFHQSQTVPPFLVVASNDLNQEKLEGQEAVFWPERRYPWGVSEAFNPHHSDLLHLRLLLLKEACDELSSAKRTRYTQWRQRELAKRMRRRPGRRLLGLLLPVLAGFVIAKTGFGSRSTARALDDVSHTLHLPKITVTSRNDDVVVEDTKHSSIPSVTESDMESAKKEVQAHDKKFMGLF
ncbi:hypothetical protein ABBQ38_008947 [Trebouxia sp. C0009 RCD-2024]